MDRPALRNAVPLRPRSIGVQFPRARYSGSSKFLLAHAGSPIRYPRQRGSRRIEPHTVGYGSTRYMAIELPFSDVSRRIGSQTLTPRLRLNPLRSVVNHGRIVSR